MPPSSAAPSTAQHHAVDGAPDTVLSEADATLHRLFEQAMDLHRQAHRQAHRLPADADVADVPGHRHDVATLWPEEGRVILLDRNALQGLSLHCAEYGGPPPLQEVLFHPDGSCSPPSDMGFVPSAAHLSLIIDEMEAGTKSSHESETRPAQDTPYPLQDQAVRAFRLVNDLRSRFSGPLHHRTDSVSLITVAGEPHFLVRQQRAGASPKLESRTFALSLRQAEGLLDLAGTPRLDAAMPDLQLVEATGPLLDGPAGEWCAADELSTERVVLDELAAAAAQRALARQDGPGLDPMEGHEPAIAACSSVMESLDAHTLRGSRPAVLVPAGEEFIVLDTWRPDLVMTLTPIRREDGECASLSVVPYALSEDGSVRRGMPMSVPAEAYDYDRHTIDFLVGRVVSDLQLPDEGAFDPTDEQAMAKRVLCGALEIANRMKDRSRLPNDALPTFVGLTWSPEAGVLAAVSEYFQPLSPVTTAYRTVAEQYAIQEDGGLQFMGRAARSDCGGRMNDDPEERWSVLMRNAGRRAAAQRASERLAEPALEEDSAPSLG